ncbi:E3 ubiquitin-protein ligase At3g02290 [Linum perenne]
MGAVCCCLHLEDCEDYVNPNSSVYRNCMCLSCFLQYFLHVYTSLFRRGEVHSVSSSIQGTASLNSPASLDNSLADMYRSPPRPLPYDADPRYFRLQRDGLVSRREKGSSHSHEEAEPLRSDNDDDDSEYYSTGDKWKASACEEGSKEQRPRSSLKLSSAKSSSGIGYIYSSSEDEEVCPTCLEVIIFPCVEYTPENPKIMTKCAHHFHLGCIYEWMERSDSCPVCGKVTFNLLILFLCVV